MKKHKVVIECANEEEARWFISAIDSARRRYAESGQRVTGAIAGIILDRSARALSAMRFEVDPVVVDLATKLEASTDYMDCNDPAGAEDYAGAKLAVDASGVTLPDQPPSLYDSLRADDHNARD